MDVNFELGEHKFVWDSEKAEKILENTELNLKMPRLFFSMNFLLTAMMNFTAITKKELKLSVRLKKFWS